MRHWACGEDSAVSAWTAQGPGRSVSQHGGGERCVRLCKDNVGNSGL